MAGATIRLYLIDGTPLGPRTVEKSNWTGKAVEFPRVSWPDIRNRDEFARPGVYVLSGFDEDSEPHIYVGEAENLKTRLEQHNSGPSQKSFWTRAVAFTSRDESFNKAHVKFIESRLVSLAQTTKRATLENANAPTAPALSEADQAEAETFLDEMLVIYPLLGVDAFTASATTSVSSGPAILHLTGRGIDAHGRDAQEGFVVLAGSTAAAKPVPSIHTYMETLRQPLKSKGLLVPQGEKLLRLTEDYTFNSPSTAAGVMLGRSSNGRVDWKDDHGVSLKDVAQGPLPG